MLFVYHDEAKNKYYLKTDDSLPKYESAVIPKDFADYLVSCGITKEDFSEEAVYKAIDSVYNFPFKILKGLAYSLLIDARKAFKQKWEDNRPEDLKKLQQNVLDKLEILQDAEKELYKAQNNIDEWVAK